ncbi:MAG: hypothetical protein IBX64_13815 [Actinobacteria bacterium]|nr:hypothetical protein [Actinomycetota bacterium]
MSGGKRFFNAILRFVQTLLTITATSLLVFFATLYFTDSRIAADLADSCLSCKKPRVTVISPLQGINSDGWSTAKDWITAISPITTEPKIVPELNPTEQQSIAVNRINHYRNLAGLEPVTLNESINKAAEAHAQYNARHTRPGHQEVPGEVGFTGVWPWDRMKYFGYEKFTYATEVASIRWASHDRFLRIDPEWAVNGWMDTVYHRFPIISPNVYEAGFGVSQVDKQLSYVMDFANPGFPEKRRMIHYPIDGQDGVPVKFTGDETPDPLPGKTYPVGYPITVTFNGYKNIKIKDIRLTGTKGVSVDFYRLLPYSDNFIWDSLAIIPKHPLEGSMVYRVAVDASADGESVQLEWSFKTK